ncbi:hypothetical protein GCM10020369_79880 [Cryptosporangium minutisporangium]|uniref:Uncharacterized protein n=1 Tax=Cryptosporangium minutisporangium TaxID=113569 RepID=A0ABP6TC66_9ACTN
MAGVAAGAVAAGAMAAAISAGVTVAGAVGSVGSVVSVGAVTSADSGAAGAADTSADSVGDDSAGVPAGVAAVLSLPEVSMTILVPVPVAGIFTTASALPPWVSRSPPPLRPQAGSRAA